MAFNLATAKPLKKKGFDLATARVPQAPPATVEQPFEPQQQPTWAQGLGTSTGFLAKPAERAVESVVRPLPERSIWEGEYWTENVPQSFSRAIPAAAFGMGNMLYGAAKEFTDPVYNALSGQQPWQEAAVDFFNAPKEAGQGVINALGEFVAAPLGLSERVTAKQAWSDPAAALMGVAPLVKPVVTGAKLPTGKGFTKRALNFSPSIKPALRQKVIETVQKEGVTLTEKSYEQYTQKLKGLLDEQARLIEPKGEQLINNTPETWISPLLKKLETSAERTKTTEAALKYLEEFKKDHPNPTLAEADLIYKDLNKTLRNHYANVQKGAVGAETGRVKAMEAISRGLRGELTKAVPELKPLNNRIHNMIVADPFIMTATNKASASVNVPGWRDLAAGAIGASYLGPEAGAASAVASRFIRDPRVQATIGKGLYNFNQFASGIKGKFNAKEISSVVDSVEAELKQQGQLPAPEGSNQLALPAPPSVIPMGPPKGEPIILGPKPSPLGLPAPPEMVPGTVSALERMFQIAQSPEGKRLLIERLKREERHSKLVAELMKIPTTQALPPGQGFLLRGKETANALGQEFGSWGPDNN